MLTKAIIPLLTLIIGALSTAWWTSKTLSVQELALAIQVKGSDKQSAVAGGWADRTIAAYVNTKESDTPAANQDDFFLVPKSIAEDVCLFPHQSIEDLQPFFLDNIKSDGMIGQNAKLAFFKSVAAYEDARNRYNIVIKLLRDGCGFLPRLADKVKSGK